MPQALQVLRERRVHPEPADLWDLQDLPVYLDLKESKERREPPEELDPRARKEYKDPLDLLVLPAT